MNLINYNKMFCIKKHKANFKIKINLIFLNDGQVEKSYESLHIPNFFFIW